MKISSKIPDSFNLENKTVDFPETVYYYVDNYGNRYAIYFDSLQNIVVNRIFINYKGNGYSLFIPFQKPQNKEIWVMLMKDWVFCGDNQFIVGKLKECLD